MSERIQVIQLDVYKCANTFGVSPCTASTPFPNNKCYNTYKTCQDKSNYVQTTDSMYFVTEGESAPLTTDLTFPTLKGFNRKAAQINPCAIDPDVNPLGKRESITIELKDHPHHDRGIDPYYGGRTYFNQGTFWGKWLARNDNFDGTQLIIYEGTNGQALSAMTPFYYVVDRIDSKSSGESVQIVAKDILKFADPERAVFPNNQVAEVAVVMTDVQTTITVNDSESWPDTGTMLVGTEQMTFTRWYNDYDFITAIIYTIVRGANSTTPATHAMGDTITLVSGFTATRIDNIIKSLLLNDAGVPSEWIDETAWDTEAAATIPNHIVDLTFYKNESLNKVIGELLRDAASFLVVDHEAKKIHFRHSSSEQNTQTITDTDNIILNSFKVNRRQQLRLTQLWMWYEIIDATGSLTDEDNFTELLVTVADDIGQATQNRNKVIYSRIFTTALATEAAETATQIMSLYGRDPVEISFDVDAKDNSIKNGDSVNISHRDYVGVDGRAATTMVRIISKAVTDNGHKIKFKAHLM